MDKNFTANSRILFPVNVQIIQKSTDGQLLTEASVKNMVLKEYGLYSWIRFILGDFKNNNLIDEGQYIPKYLAVGSNQTPSNGAPGTDIAVKITDISLYHEINDSDVTGEPINKNRIPLNRANYIEDIEDQSYLKIQYEAYIPEDRFVNQTIGEFALMTKETGYNAFARVTGFEPFVKVPNSVVQIIWEITVVSIESSTKFIPLVKTYLREAIEKAINILQEYTNDPVDLKNSRVELDKLIEPATVTGTGLWYLLNENEQITQEAINNFLSKPFNSITDTGLIPFINKFDPEWKPSGYVI